MAALSIPFRPTMATHFIRDFRTDIRGNAAAMAAIFAQDEPGRPFFFATEDPNQIGFIYTDKRGMTYIRRLFVKSHFTGDTVTTGYMDALGVSSIEPEHGTLGHLIVAHYEDRHPVLPHFRLSSDPSAISLTCMFNGARADLRLLFFTADTGEPVQLAINDLEHIYSSAYNRYYMRPATVAAAAAATG
jgi:hypothetical protein